MRVLLYIFLVIGVYCPPVIAADLVQGPIRAEVLRVVDGDTLAVRALIWPGHRVEVKVRLAEVNTPELFRPSCDHERVVARTATDFVREKTGDQVELINIHFGKYAGRVVANVRITSGADLGELLMTEGLAHQQGDRSGWCALVN